MPNIPRTHYLDLLRKKEKNGLAKIITGLRRVGKSYLLFRLFYQDLIMRNIPADHIIMVALDDMANEDLRERHTLYNYVKSKIVDNDTHYVFIDEIQFVDKFIDMVNGFLHIPNLDVYITGSNSHMLSSDVLTEFRDRGDEIRVYPLSFKEFFNAYNGSVDDAWEEYIIYGGMPRILAMDDDTQKSGYLSHLAKTTFIRDMVERANIRRVSDFEELINVLASSIGSLTNPSKLQNTFNSTKKGNITDKTIKSYIETITNAFIIDSAQRYDIKGKQYINSKLKYYFTDIGVRNAFLNFRQIEETHIMENIIFNELKRRGFNVDIGIVEHRELNSLGKQQRKQLEIDFVANRGNKKYYIQSAFSLDNPEKRVQEEKSLQYVSDSFKKIIITKRNVKNRRNEMGITTIGLKDFLLDENSLDF